MAFLSSLNIAASGMAAERLRLDVISQNVANAKTHQNGGRYAVQKAGRTVQRKQGFQLCA